MWECKFHHLVYSSLKLMDFFLVFINFCTEISSTANCKKLSIQCAVSLYSLKLYLWKMKKRKKATWNKMSFLIASSASLSSVQFNWNGAFDGKKFHFVSLFSNARKIALTQFSIFKNPRNSLLITSSVSTRREQSDLILIPERNANDKM